MKAVLPRPPHSCMCGDSVGSECPVRAHEGASTRARAVCVCGGGGMPRRVQPSMALVDLTGVAGEVWKNLTEFGYLLLYGYGWL